MARGSLPCRRELWQAIAAGRRFGSIIGCGGCMNESLAYDGDLCIFKDGNSLPAATVHELNKLKEYLHKNNYSVETKYYDDINGFWCMRSIDCQDYDLSWNIQPDIILVLSCPSGQHALSEELSGYTVIGITETLGGLSYCYRDVAGDRFIIKEKSRVLPIQ